MAARIFLLSILFTEVLKPACAAGVKGIGTNINNRNVSKSDGSDADSTKGFTITTEIEPSGHVILGKKTIILDCLADTNQTISWLRNGKPVPPCGSTRCSVQRNGSLLYIKKQNFQKSQKFKEKENTSLTNIKNHIKDEYRCITRTDFGGLLRSSPTFIEIAELAHVFKESPENVTVQEGEVVRLSCIIDSVPFPPNVTWEHNGKSVLLSLNNSKYSMVSPGVLYISTTQLSDAGSYRCVVTNEFLKKTKKSKEAQLTVIARSENEKSYKSPSLFPQTSYNHWLLNGSNLNLACAASGYPLPLITWTFIPRYTGNSNVPQPRILVNSTTGIAILELRNVSIFDAGIYVCSSKNSTNDLEIQNITVDILVPPSFLKTPTNHVCPNGRTARFECQAQGLPVPQIYWLKDSLNITVNGRRTTYVKEYNTMQLAISATVPADSGLYQCVAVNSAGEIWAAGRLQVNSSRNSPAAPTSLKCHAVSPVRIFISWEPPKSLPYTSITAYTVHYSPAEGGKEEVSPPEPGNSTSVEVTKLLEPFTNYSFYVRVWNIHGASDQSATILCSTAPSVPKSTPKININVISNTKLNVSWEPLTKKESRGIVVEYKLQWRLHQHPSSRVIFLPANIEYYILSDLIRGAKYDVRIIAKTKQGWPNLSEMQLNWSTVTMPSIDYNEFNIRNFVEMQLLSIKISVVKVIWKINLKENKIEPDFDSWQIYCEDSDGYKLLTAFLPRNATEYTLTNNLERNCSYTVGLCMVNSGEVKYCLTKIIDITHSGSSNVFMALEAIPVSSTSINVTWAVTEMHSAHSFELCYHAVHIENSEESKCITLDDTKMIVDKLKPFTLYQFKVRMIRHENNQSNIYSESVECYTNEDVPGKVEDIQWFLGNNTQVRIAWKEPSSVNGVIQNYFVAFTMELKDPIETWGNVTVPGNKTSTTLPGLVPGKRYFVIVQAATKAGYGKPSNPIIIITGGTAIKIPTSSNEQKPPQNIKPDQSLGIILGVSISIVLITICLCSIYCRNKCESSRSLRDGAQPLKGRILVRNGNGCCIESTAPVNQQMNVTVSSNDVELAGLCPSSPVSNPHSDTKGGHSNGVVEPCVKEPLLSPWDVNGESKDICLTENPQYKRRDSTVLRKNEEESQDLDDTQFTMVNCTLDSNSGSLNNNSGCQDNDISSENVTCTSVPVLGPNG
ncbi:PREDICTED: protogenin-like [Polistes canadensis]|uniref:protogenin-like n=1 Tax=Polistes canadensis TaxID=91411 RepID=UPI000718E1F6|nr:PREDICTED: protogenin-like [Polistes canadensis]